MKLELTNLDALPIRGKSRVGMELLREFISSDSKYAEVTASDIPEGKTPRDVARALYQLTYQHKMPIKVHQRGMSVFLEKVEVENETN